MIIAVIVRCYITFTLSTVRRNVYVQRYTNQMNSKARFKRRILHVPNLMQMKKIHCSRSLALDSAHVKCDVKTGPKFNNRLTGIGLFSWVHFAFPNKDQVMIPQGTVPLKFMYVHMHAWIMKRQKDILSGMSRDLCWENKNYELKMSLECFHSRDQWVCFSTKNNTTTVSFICFTIKMQHCKSVESMIITVI